MGTHAFRSSIGDRAREKRKNQTDKVGINQLTESDIFEHVSDSIDKRRFSNVFNYVTTEKGMLKKGKMIWCNIINHKPFIENNELHALECMYYFLRANRLDMKFEDMKIIADQYMTYVELYQNSNSDFLDVLFGFRKFKKNEEVGDVWNFKDRYPAVRTAILHKIKTGRYSYEGNEESPETKN